jgi:hypothetical protein
VPSLVPSRILEPLVVPKSTLLSEQDPARRRELAGLATTDDLVYGAVKAAEHGPRRVAAALAVSEA